MRFVGTSSGAGQAIKTALHGFSRPHQSVTFQMLRERDEDDHDEGLFPHRQQNGADDGHGGEDLEANLAVAQTSRGLTEHFRPTDDDRQRCESTKQKFRRVEHLHQDDDWEKGKREGTTHQTTLIWSETIRVRQSKARSRTKQVRQRLVTVGFEGIRHIGKQLQQHAVISRDFSVKHTRLPSEQAVQSCHWDAASGCQRRGRYALQLLMRDVGSVPEGAKNACCFSHGSHGEVDVHADFARGRGNLRGPNLVQMLQSTGGLGRTIRAIHAQDGPGDLVLTGGFGHDFSFQDRSANRYLRRRWRRFSVSFARGFDGGR